MPEGPSIKGSIIAPSVAELSKLLEDGKITRQNLEPYLEPDDWKLFDYPISPSHWYGMDVYRRVMTALRDVAGGRSDDFLRQAGARQADALLKQGLYQQMRYLGHLQLSGAQDPRARLEALRHDLKLISTLGAVVQNHGRWDVKPDPEFPDRLMIELSEASAFPDVYVPAFEGFCNRMSREANEPDLWRAERPSPDVIRLRMARPF